MGLEICIKEFWELMWGQCYYFNQCYMYILLEKVRLPTVGLNYVYLTSGDFALPLAPIGGTSNPQAPCIHPTFIPWNATVQPAPL